MVLEVEKGDEEMNKRRAVAYLGARFKVQFYIKILVPSWNGMISIPWCDNTSTLWHTLERAKMFLKISFVLLIEFHLVYLLIKYKRQSIELDYIYIVSVLDMFQYVYALRWIWISFIIQSSLHQLVIKSSLKCQVIIERNSIELVKIIITYILINYS